MPWTPSVPAYRHHKARGLAVVTVRQSDGTRRNIYLGKFNSPESRAEYARIVAELAVQPLPSPKTVGTTSCLTVAELLAAFKVHAEVHYRDKDGKPTSEYRECQLVSRTLREMYADLPAADFSPLKLKAVRQVWVNAGLSRRECNRRANIVRRILKWAAGEEMVPHSTYQSLASVTGLQVGRTEAPDNGPRKAADPEALAAALRHLHPMLSAAVRLIYLTGARPAEILRMRPSELDRSGNVWKLTPERHKGTWKGRGRIIYLGPEAQSVLTPWLLKTPGQEAYIFSPARAVAEMHAERTTNRVTRLWPSHAKRNALNRRPSPKYKPPGEYYKPYGVRQAIARACGKANVEPFTPYQLRHLRGAELREQFGMEYCRAVLGHSYAAMSDHYSRAADEKLAAAVAAKIG